VSSKGVLKYVSPYQALVPRDDLSGQVLIFTHIPKSAGTSLDHVLAAMAAVRGLRFKRAMGTLYGIFLGKGKGEAATDFAQMQNDAREQLDIISGHLPFGAHHRLTRPAFYATILREPVARLVSHFRFGVRREGWPASEPFDDLFRQGHMIDNLQTRQLAGMSDPTLPCTAAVLDQAISNLQDRYGIVGTTDAFDSVLKALIALFRWPDVAYSDRQVGQPEPYDEGLHARAVAAVERYFAYDRELYTRVQARQAPWRTDLFEGAAEGSRRQNQVLVASPLLREQPFTLMPSNVFDESLCPPLRQGGIELRFA